jgi:hypothetical protein
MVVMLISSAVAISAGAADGDAQDSMGLSPAFGLIYR